MKGIVKITVTDKDGNIKTVRQENKIFDIPKELMKELVKGAAFPGLDGPNNLNTGNQMISVGYSLALSYLEGYEDWFRAIRVNDEYCSENDYTDVQVPVLFGSEFDQLQATNTRYAKLHTSSERTDNILKKVYTWPDSPAFELKSINLCHCNCMSRNPANGIDSETGSFLVKYGKFYMSRLHYGGTRIFNRYYNYLYEDNGTFIWANNRLGFDTTKIYPIGYTGDSYYSILDLIYTAKDREIILLTKSNNLTTQGDAYGPRYVTIIDADSGNIKRCFPFTQFNGVPNFNQWTTVYAKVFTTEFGNFLMLNTKESTPYKINIYRIPDQSEMSNYSNNETIPIWYEDLNTNLFNRTDWNGMMRCCTIIKNIAMFTYDGNYTYNKSLKINSATQGDITLYNYIPVNTGSISTSYNDYAGNHATKYYDSLILKNGVPTWYNTTVLNLQTPVTVTAGATLKIEYTIVASNE